MTTLNSSVNVHHISSRRLWRSRGTSGCYHCRHTTFTRISWVRLDARQPLNDWFGGLGSSRFAPASLRWWGSTEIVYQLDNFKICRHVASPLDRSRFWRLLSRPSLSAGCPVGILLALVRVRIAAQGC